MTDKHIKETKNIIDGVDVSGCKFFNINDDIVDE